MSRKLVPVPALRPARTTPDQAAATSAKVERRRKAAAEPCPNPLFVSVPAVAKRLGVGETTAWVKLIGGGLISVVKIGRRTLVAVTELERYAASLQGR